MSRWMRSGSHYPKAYLFTLAVFPQFMKPEYGDIVALLLAIAAYTAFEGWRSI